MRSSANISQITLIAVLSVAVPGLVAMLLFSDHKTQLGEWVRILPHLNAIFNSITSITLILGLIMIKRGQIIWHRFFMTLSFVLGALFLVSYVTYHSSVPSVMYGDLDGNGVLSTEEINLVGSGRGIYLFLLLSHIALSVVVVPFVLMAFYYALSDKINKHKKIVKFTWPIWFYVSITGVLVYLMISPYYQ